METNTCSQCRINHMAEAAYATGPALLGAPRFSLLLFSEFFVPCFSAGPMQTIRQCGAPKSPSPPKNSRPPKIGPKRFHLFLVLVFQRGAPNSPKSPENVIGPKSAGPQTIFLFPVLARDPNSAGP
jgi:hypothetical protein